MKERCSWNSAFTPATSQKLYNPHIESPHPRLKVIFSHSMSKLTLGSPVPSDLTGWTWG